MRSHPAPNQCGSRRDFLVAAGTAGVGLGLGAGLSYRPATGADSREPGPDAGGARKVWTPISDRRIRLGIVGNGHCRFGTTFGFEDHPNVEVVAVADLFPERCADLARAVRCDTTYPSLEKLVEDDSIEAVFIATDAPSHAAHAILALEHGKHVAVAVPAVFGSLDDAHRLFETVTTTGRKYMMFETSWFRPECCAMRALFRAGALGPLRYTEGEDFHYHASKTPTPSHGNWRCGFPPLWYPTHATAFHTGVSGGHFRSVSGRGLPGHLPYHEPDANPYGNRFGGEYAMLETTDGAVCRVLYDSSSRGENRETGRVCGRLGSYANGRYAGTVAAADLPDLSQPPLPPGIDWPADHGFSHGRLTDEFVSAILADRTPEIHVGHALAMTVAGVIAHESALKDGEVLAIPQFSFAG